MDVAARRGPRGEPLPHLDRVVAGLRLDSPRRDVPDRLRLVTVLSVGDDEPAGERVREGAHLAHGAACGGLSREALRAIPRAAEVAGEQMNAMYQPVDCRSARVLVHAHAPEAGDAQVTVGEQPGQHANLGCGHAGEPAATGRRKAT